MSKEEKSQKPSRHFMSVYDSAFWIDADKSTGYRIVKVRLFKMKNDLHYFDVKIIITLS